jgi:hypothetical protein
VARVLLLFCILGISVATVPASTTLEASAPNLRAVGLCGNCPFEPFGYSSPTGAYKFDSGVPEHVRQATFWADDGWNRNYYDPNDPNATTIYMYTPSNPNEYGQYDPFGNGIGISEPYANQCSSACNPLISTISHEFGHTAGIGDFTTGCESSIMAHGRDRNSVISPSEEDLCWWANWGAGPNWECPELPCIPYDRGSGKSGTSKGGRSGGGGSSRYHTGEWR